MFGKKDASSSSSSTTLVSKNTEIVGDIHFSGSLMIEGTVKGNVYSSSGEEAHAHLLDTGVVEGELRVPTIVINGTVTGDVFSDKHIELSTKAVVNGNVHYDSIEMLKGAQVNGNLLYGATEQQKTKSVDALAGKANSGAEAQVSAEIKTLSSTSVKKA